MTRLDQRIGSARIAHLLVELPSASPSPRQERHFSSAGAPFFALPVGSDQFSGDQGGRWARR
jgi:hypothetical protein